MELSFKPIQDKDQTQVINLFKAAAHKINRMNIKHWQYWKNPPKEKLEWVEEGIKSQEYYFVKNQEEETIGMLRILDEDLLYWGQQSKKAKYIHSLVVVEKYNGKGIGKQIIDKVEKRAKKEHCQYLRLDADSKNPKLCRYYEKQGFKKVGTKQLPISTYNLYEKKI